MEKLSLKQEMHITEIQRERNGYALSAGLFGGNPVVAAKKLQIEGNYTLLQNSISGKLVDGSGNEEQKILLRNTVTETLGNMARGCSVYFEDNDLLDTAAILSRPKSYYDHLKQEEIVSVLRSTRGVLFTNESHLTDYGVDSEWFILVDGQITDLEEVIPVIGNAHVGTGASNANVDKYIALIDKGFEQLFKLVISFFLASNKDEVEAFLLTKGENIVGRHHNNVDCSMKKSPDMGAINNGLIIITDPATGLEVKRIIMDAYGLGDCIMKLGSFYADASAPGCLSQRQLFKTVYRGTFHLDFVMLPGTDAVVEEKKVEEKASEGSAETTVKTDAPIEPKA
jgi:hypothetical protein